VVGGLSGEFFSEQSIDGLAAAIEGFRPDQYDPAAIRENARRFDASVFRAQIGQMLGL
jgi:hypothetical protein